jgi:hypothetical protein
MHNGNVTSGKRVVVGDGSYKEGQGEIKLFLGSKIGCRVLNSYISRFPVTDGLHFREAKRIKQEGGGFTNSQNQSAANQNKRIPLH